MLILKIKLYSKALSVNSVGKTLKYNNELISYPFPLIISVYSIFRLKSFHDLS